MILMILLHAYLYYFSLTEFLSFVPKEYLQNQVIYICPLLPNNISKDSLLCHKRPSDIVIEVCGFRYLSFGLFLLLHHHYLILFCLLHPCHGLLVFSSIGIPVEEVVERILRMLHEIDLGQITLNCDGSVCVYIYIYIYC